MGQRFWIGAVCREEGRYVIGTETHHLVARAPHGIGRYMSQWLYRRGGQRRIVLSGAEGRLAFSCRVSMSRFKKVSQSLLRPR